MSREIGSLDVLAQVGGAVERIETFPPLRGQAEESVTIALELADHAAVSLTFAASAFRAFADRLSRFARTLPGRPC